MIVCRELIDFLLDYLHDDLAADIRADFEKHMRLCPPCLVFLNTYRKTMSMTQDLRLSDIPEEVKQNLREFLSQRVIKA